MPDGSTDSEEQLEAKISQFRLSNDLLSFSSIKLMRAKQRCTARFYVRFPPDSFPAFIDLFAPARND